MNIDRTLKLVIPLEQANGTNYVFAEPVDRTYFDRYARLFARTFNDIMTDGGGVTSGPRIAMQFLKENAKSLGLSETEDLTKEIIRTANMAVLGTNGWETIPLEDVIRRKLIDEDEASEVENALAFFTVAWRMFRKNERAGMIASGALLWGAQISSSTIMEFVTSLKTSIKEESSGAKVPLSSIPS